MIEQYQILMKGVVFILIIGLIIRILYIKRRNSRLLDLMHHIDMIMDPNGCADALNQFAQAKHILNHYEISWDEVHSIEFDDACSIKNMDMLYHHAIISEKKAIKRKEKTLKIWDLDAFRDIKSNV